MPASSEFCRQWCQPNYEQRSHLASNTVALRFGLNYRKAIGYIHVSRITTRHSNKNLMSPVMTVVIELLLEPTHNVYGGGSELPFLNGLIRIAFIHGNEHLEKEDGIPLDGKILFGSTIVAPGDQYRETGRKSVRQLYSLNAIFVKRVTLHFRII